MRFVETEGVLGDRKSEWDASYENRDNFVFYPNEEVIRFVSKFIRKRIGFGEFRDVTQESVQGRVLDLGCGDGSLLQYLKETKGIFDIGLEIDELY